MSDLDQRIFELARARQLINVATVAPDGHPRVRYVVGQTGPDLTIRFSTHLDSIKVAHLAGDPRVHVTLGASHVRSGEWLEIEGTAVVSTQEEERRGFWFEELTYYFTGIDDPRYCIVVITPESIKLGSEVWRAPVKQSV